MIVYVINNSDSRVLRDLNCERGLARDEPWKGQALVRLFFFIQIFFKKNYLSIGLKAHLGS